MVWLRTEFLCLQNQQPSWMIEIPPQSIIHYAFGGKQGKQEGHASISPRHDEPATNTPKHGNKGGNGASHPEQGACL